MRHYSLETKKILEASQAIITNTHVIYTSGRHGDAYINKDAIYPHTDLVSKLCSFFAEHFKNSGVEVVIAPALGGIILSQWTAWHLSQMLNKKILSLYAEKIDGENFAILRGYDSLLNNKKVLILEDVLTTGGSIKKVIEQVKKLNGEIVGVGTLCNRGGIEAKALEVKNIFSLITLDLNSWESQDCPLCKKNIPINTQVGKGKTLK